MVGIYPKEYELNAKIEKPIDDIYRDLDAFTWERLVNEGPDEVLSLVVQPPLKWDGRLVKGILFTYGADYLIDRFPQIQELFRLVVTSRWCSLPWSKHADGIFGLYDNPRRFEWFRSQYPQRNSQVILPFQEADWTNEALIRPIADCEKDVDLICMSRLTSFKNLPFLSSAAAVYKRKYGPLRVLLLNGYRTPFAELAHSEQQILKSMRQANPWFDETFELHEFVEWGQLSKVFSRAKASVMTSLIEGKNRAIHEAMCADLPLLCLADFNRYARGDAALFPEKAGVLAPFDQEQFADAAYHLLNHLPEFKARESYLDGFSGLKHVYRETLASFSGLEPIYREYIQSPDELNHHMFKTYGQKLENYLYGRDPQLWNRVSGDRQHKLMLEYHFGCLVRGPHLGGGQ